MSSAALLANRPANTLEAFKARCWARALLVREGVMEFYEAIDGLQNAAVAYGLIESVGQDEIQHLMSEAFGEGLPELHVGVDEMVRRLELQDPRDRWQHTGEGPPPESVRNSDIAGPQESKPRPYRTPQATVDAFFFVTRTKDADGIAEWLAAHPRDAHHLHKLWKQKCSTAAAK
jgi:hypothetical protein